MNTKNNRRKRESKAKIESVFMELLQTRELNRITVSDICKLAGVNRSTFYANYGDIYVLADTVRENLERNLGELYRDQVVNSFNDNDYLKLFRHIAENPLFYQTYFKLGYDNRYQILAYDKKLAAEHFDNRFIPYHIAFYKSGLTAVIKMWLAGGCRETPEEINEIVVSEYRGRVEFFDRKNMGKAWNP